MSVEKDTNEIETLEAKVESLEKEIEGKNEYIAELKSESDHFYKILDEIKDLLRHI